MEPYLKIRELKSLLQKRSETTNDIRKLKAPTLTDLSHIKAIYSIYLDLLQRKSWSESNVHHRNKFIFVVLYFYSPIALVGGSTAKGVRSEIARVIGVAPTVISNNIKNVTFSYTYYSDFREDVDHICSLVKQRLGV